MPIDLYPSIAKVKRGGVYQNLPGFVQQSGDTDIKAMIANSEISTTAQYAHPKGSYFILNDVLYKAIIDIAVNDTIAVGTNCEVAILCDDVTEIENNVSDLKADVDFNVDFENKPITAYSGAISGAVAGTSLGSINLIESSTRIRSINSKSSLLNLIELIPNRIYSISAASGYKYAYQIFNENSKATADFTYTTSPTTIRVPDKAYILFVLAKTDDSSISTTEITNLVFRVKTENTQAQALKALIKKTAYSETLTNEYFDFLSAFGFEVFGTSFATRVNTYISTQTMKIAGGGGISTDKSAYIKIKPSTKYIIKKTLTNTFRIGFTQDEPSTTGVSVSSTEANHTGTVIEATSGANDNWLFITYGNLNATYTESILAEVFKSIGVYEE